MRVDHLRFRRYLDAFVDGELDGALRSEVAAHVAACTMCTRDADVTVHMKHSLARHRGFSGRAADQMWLWVRRSLG